MFKSLFTFLKALFTSAEDLTGVMDNAINFALLHSETWVDEALSENQKKAEELGLDPAYKAEKLKSLRKSQNR